MLNAPLRILIVAALCALGLVGLVVRESMARAAGTEVLLAMEAVDPRALLSGHYVIVGLQTIAPPGACSALDAGPADGEWLALTPSGPETRVPRPPGMLFYTPISRHNSRADAQRTGQLAVRGQANCTETTMGGGNSLENFPVSIVRTNLEGLDRFHINQADAERIDRILRAQTPGGQVHAFAIISIGQDGRARLKGLMIDGQRLELSWL